METSTTSAPPTQQRLIAKAFLLAPLLFTLYTIDGIVVEGEDHDDGGGHHRHHRRYPAFVQALHAHPPSLRVFRGLSELALLLFCTAISLKVWEGVFSVRRWTTPTKSTADGEEEVGDDGVLHHHPQQQWTSFNEQVGCDVVGKLLFEPADRNIRLDDNPRGDDTHCGVVGRGDDDDSHRECHDDDDEDDDGGDEEDDDDDARVGEEEMDQLRSQRSHDLIDLGGDGGGDGDMTGVSLEEGEEEERDGGSSNSYSNNNGDGDEVEKNIPPPSSVAAESAMDLLVLILLFLVLFTLSSRGVVAQRQRDGQASTTAAAASASAVDAFTVALSAVAAPVFPLALFLSAAYMALWPWYNSVTRSNNGNSKRVVGRRGFWKVVSYTIEAPFHEVTFRDGFVGDILTSTVRPLQDVAFTLFYLASGLQGWWSSLYSLEEADAPLESNWLLHTVVLPACMISPLWCRFLQNLRQSYEAKKRWPYLGNALKYFIAAEVALFGVYDPSNKRKVVWIAAFFFATLYQVWWDVFMDWELFVVSWGGADAHGGDRRSDHRFSYSRGGPTSDTTAARRRPPLMTVRLREERLYRSRSMYYTIFVINFFLRFCWTLSFIPPRYLSRSGKLVEAFSAELRTFVVPAVASAEIIRRMLWGLLRLELEAIKLQEAKDAERGASFELKNRKEVSEEEEEDEGGGATHDKEGASLRGLEMEVLDDMEPMAVQTGWSTPPGSPIIAASSLFGFGGSGRGSSPPWKAYFGSDMSNLTDMQILGELCLYGTVFASLGIFAAAHRQ